MNNFYFNLRKLIPTNKEVITSLVNFELLKQALKISLNNLNSVADRLCYKKP